MSSQTMQSSVTTSTTSLSNAAGAATVLAANSDPTAVGIVPGASRTSSSVQAGSRLSRTLQAGMQRRTEKENSAADRGLAKVFLPSWESGVIPARAFNAVSVAANRGVGPLLMHPAVSGMTTAHAARTLVGDDFEIDKLRTMVRKRTSSVPALGRKALDAA